MNLSDFDGQTPLHTAVTCGRLNVVNLLLEEGAGKEKKQTRKEHLSYICEVFRSKQHGT